MKKRVVILFFLLLLISGASLFAQKPGPQGGRQGQAFIDSLLRELPKAKEDTLKVLLLNRLSFCYYASDPNAGIKYGESGLALAEKLHWKPGMANAYNSMGVDYLNMGNTEKAMENYMNAYKINSETGNNKKRAQNLGNIANLYFLQSDYASSLDFLFKALKIFEEINDKEGEAVQFGNIANVYHIQRDFSKALEYELMALNNKRELGDKQGEATMLGNIGNEYDAMGKHDTALAKDMEAMKIFEETGNTAGIALNLENIGEVYGNEQSYYKALENKFKALKIYEGLGDKWAIARCYGSIGENYLAIAKDTGNNTAAPAGGIVTSLETGIMLPESKPVCLHKAIEYLSLGVKICSETGFLDYLQRFLLSLSDAEALSGDPGKALETYKQYVAVKDSVYSTESKLKIKNLETKRELGLKDKQIQIDQLEVAKKRNERVFYIVGIGLLLAVIVVVSRNYRVQKSLNGLLTVEKKKVERRTEELNVTNQELNTTLENLKETQQQLIETEKQKENEMIRNRISQDIHDDISSELTRISWMSETAKLKGMKSGIGEVSPLLEKITSSSRETIGKLGEIIWAVNPENDNIENLAAYMRNYTAKFFTDTSFDYTLDFPEKVEPLPINPELKRNLFLVMKEALNNAVKYSQAKRITVSLKLHNNNYTLAVADDGKGIDENIILGGGNGLKNMRSRMKAVNGSCSIISKPGAGARIIFEGKLY